MPKNVHMESDKYSEGSKHGDVLVSRIGWFPTDVSRKGFSKAGGFGSKDRPTQ